MKSKDGKEKSIEYARKSQEANKKNSGVKFNVRKLGMDEFPSFKSKYQHKEGFVTPRVVHELGEKEVRE